MVRTINLIMIVVSYRGHCEETQSVEFVFVAICSRLTYNDCIILAYGFCSGIEANCSAGETGDGKRKVLTIE